MFTYPYQIIKRKLTIDIPEIRELEWYTNQDSTKDKNASLKASPGIYIMFYPSDVDTLSGTKIQSSDAEFEATLLTECLFDDDKRIKKDSPQDHMIILDKIFKSLHGFSAKISYLPDFASLAGTKNDQRSFNSISRISLVPPHTPRKAIMKSVQRFRGLFYDHAASKLYTSMAKPPLEVETEVDVPVFPFFDSSFEDFV
jgi:hypothetical protein